MPLPCPTCRTTYTKRTQKTCGAFLADDNTLKTLAAAETKCASLGASCGVIYDKQCMGPGEATGTQNPTGVLAQGGAAFWGSGA